MFFDTHTHLNFDSLAHRLPDILKESANKRLCRFLVPAVDRESWSDILTLSGAYNEIFVALGLHPCFIEKHAKNDLCELELELLNNNVVALGEIGLDKRAQSYEFQLQLFEAQLDMAQRLRLPVILHSVRAHEDVLSALARFNLVGGVIHAFSGGSELLDRYIDAGMHIGIGGVITRENATKARSAVSIAPLERLLLETDSPDMRVASKLHLKTGSPIDVLDVFECLCELRQESATELEQRLWKNALSLFAIPEVI